MSALSVKSPEVWQASLGFLGGYGMIRILYSVPGTRAFTQAKVLSYAQSLSHLIQVGLASGYLIKGCLGECNETKSANLMRSGALLLFSALSGVVEPLDIVSSIAIPLHLLGTVSNGAVSLWLLDCDDHPFLKVSMFAYAASSLWSCMRFSAFASPKLAAFTQFTGALFHVMSLKNGEIQVSSELV